MSATMSVVVRKNVFLWPLVMAIICELPRQICGISFQTNTGPVEFVGLTVNLYHSHHPAQHSSFLAGIAPMLVAPVLLAIANFSVFHRLVSWTVAASKRTSHPVWQGVQSLASLFPIVGATPLILYTMGVSDMCQYLTTKPIENANGALLRILFHERAQRMLFSGHVVELVCLAVFAVLSVVVFASAPRGQASDDFQAPKDAKRLFWTVSSVNALCLVRAVFQVIAFMTAEAHGSKTAGRSNVFSLMDAGPVIAAMLILCLAQPAHYLPEQFTSVVLYDGQEEYEKV